MLSEKIRDQLLELQEQELEEAFRLLEGELKRRKRKQALAAISEIAEGAGIDLLELLERHSKDLRGTFAPQDESSARDDSSARAQDDGRKLYVHPDRPDLTWDGRGRHPYWFKDLLQEGYSPELLLKKSR